MNPRLVRQLIGLYPPAWRVRYRVEFQQFLETHPSNVRTIFNVIRCAMYERVLSLGELKMDQRQSSLTLMLYAYLGAIAAGVQFLLDGGRYASRGGDAQSLNADDKLELGQSGLPPVPCRRRDGRRSCNSGDRENGAGRRSMGRHLPPSHTAGGGIGNVGLDGCGRSICRRPLASHALGRERGLGGTSRLAASHHSLGSEFCDIRPHDRRVSPECDQPPPSHSPERFVEAPESLLYGAFHVAGRLSGDDGAWAGGVGVVCPAVRDS